MIAKEILEFGLKSFNGFLPVLKPRGICCRKLLFVLKTDIHFVLNHHEVKHGSFDVNFARILEPFAVGLVTFVIGRDNNRKRNFVYADYKYKALIEFGVERQGGCLDGKIIGNSRVDHLNVGLIEAALPNFVGLTSQIRKQLPTSIFNEADYYDRILLPNDKPRREPQKYPFIDPPRPVTCYSIQLTDFNPPFAKFDILCQGSFGVRQFVEDLAEILDTKASLIELERVEEGPMHINDIRVLKLYELNLEYYIQKIASLHYLYDDYIKKFDDKFEKLRIPRHI